jgi:hypothetical protein
LAGGGGLGIMRGLRWMRDPHNLTTLLNDKKAQRDIAIPLSFFMHKI